MIAVENVRLFQELEARTGDLTRSVGELSPRSMDAIASVGERLSSLVVTFAFRSAGMRTQHVDARRVIVTDNRFTQAQPLFEDTYARLQENVKPAAETSVVVMGGFIGATKDGQTTTLGRGGSDFSASIVGAGVCAEEIQIWTDVDGMLTADPRLVPGGHRVKSMSFAEAAEMAYFGAKVLHPATVLPAVEKNIPVLILNSRRPEAEGQLIPSRPDFIAQTDIDLPSVVVLDRLENQQAIGEYLNSRRVPNIEIQTPANLAQDQVWSFGVTIDHAVQGALVADYFVKVLHAEKVAIVSENTPTLDPGRNAFTKEIKALHADLAYAKTVEGQANDFSNEALGLSRSGATATCCSVRHGVGGFGAEQLV